MPVIMQREKHSTLGFGINYRHEPRGKDPRTVESGDHYDGYRHIRRKTKAVEMNGVFSVQGNIALNPQRMNSAATRKGKNKVCRSSVKYLAADRAELLVWMCGQ